MPETALEITQPKAPPRILITALSSALAKRVSAFGSWRVLMICLKKKIFFSVDSISVTPMAGAAIFKEMPGDNLVFFGYACEVHLFIPLFNLVKINPEI